MSIIQYSHRLFLKALLAMAAAGVSSAVCAQQVTVSGSSTIAPLVSEIGKRFEQRHPGVRVDVQSGGSSRGMSDARQGLSQIGMVSRALKADEADLTAIPIAMDGVSVILHRSNTVSTLSDAQIKAIYTGEIRNWKALGGPDRTITVVNKAEGRSTLELFLHHFQLKNKDIRAQVVIGENQQGIKTVAGNPGAIGYVSIGTAEYEAERGHANPAAAHGRSARHGGTGAGGQVPAVAPPEPGDQGGTIGDHPHVHRLCAIQGRA